MLLFSYMLFYCIAMIASGRHQLDTFFIVILYYVFFFKYTFFELYSDRIVFRNNWVPFFIRRRIYKFDEIDKIECYKKHTNSKYGWVGYISYMKVFLRNGKVQNVYFSESSNSEMRIFMSIAEMYVDMVYCKEDWL